MGTIREAFAQSAVTATTFIWTWPGDLLMMKGGIMLETIVRDQQWFIKMAKLLISTMQAACCMEVGFLIWTFFTKVLLEQRTRRAGCTSTSGARLYISIVSRQLNLSFYNGQARVQSWDGSWQVINELAETLVQIDAPEGTDVFGKVSADLVGFWKTQTLCAAVEMGVSLSFGTGGLIA